MESKFQPDTKFKFLGLMKSKFLVKMKVRGK